jgi:hypothetical protein
MHRAGAHLAIQHCGLRHRYFPLRHHLAFASIASSVLVKLSPLQPPILAAEAGATATMTAAIAAAPSNLLIM